MFHHAQAAILPATAMILHEQLADQAVSVLRVAVVSVHHHVADLSHRPPVAVLLGLHVHLSAAPPAAVDSVAAAVVDLSALVAAIAGAHSANKIRTHAYMQAFFDATKYH